jgi:5-methyltetrahydropteroyltriglutamate--homocysteine methyltransferase
VRTGSRPLAADLRADQVGSLLRPDWLKEAYGRHDRGETSKDELRLAQDEAIRDVIAKQEAHGVAVLTDGEFRRLNFQDSFAASVVGFAAADNTARFHEQRVAGGQPLRRWDPGYSGSGPAVVHRRPTVERLRLVLNQPLDEYLFASRVATRPVKVTLIGPDRIVQRFDYESSRSVYADVDEFMSDVVSIERQIIGGLVEAGCPYVQIDAPSYTAYVDPPSIEEMRGRGEDPMANMERSIEADNALIADFPCVTFGIHLCRGNQRSMWHREGSYDAIAERLFGTLEHARFLLEYDSERAGGFEPLRFVPQNKTVVLGLVSTKVPELEPADHLERRIEQASHYLPLEQLAISPQCGFASDIAGNLLTEDDQWRKLELANEVAARVWG